MGLCANFIEQSLEPVVETSIKLNILEKENISLIIPFKIVEIPEMVMSIKL